MLVLAHNLLRRHRGQGRGEGPAMSPKSVHRDGARIEAAFRQLFHRSDPAKVRSLDPGVGEGCIAWNVRRLFMT